MHPGKAFSHAHFGKFCERCLHVLSAAIVLTIAAVPVCSAQPERRLAGDPETIEAGFQRALAEMRGRDYRTAIQSLRRLLAANPFLTRVRLELARAYFENGDFDQAREEFFRVLSGDLPDVARRNVLSYVRAIDARKGYDWDFGVALAVSPNAGRRYRSDTVELDFLGQRLPFTLERPDPPLFELHLDGSAEVRSDLEFDVAGGRFIGFVDGYFDVTETDGETFDDRLVGANAGLRAAWPRTTAEIGPRVSLRQLGGEHFEDQALLEASLETRTAEGVSTFGSFAAGYAKNRARPALSGEIVRGRFGASRSVGSIGTVGGVLTLQRRDANADYESYYELEARLFGSTDIANGVSLDGSIFADFLHFDGRAPLFAGLRKDREVGFDLKATKNDLFVLDRFSPFVSVGASMRRSSIDAFGYDELRLTFGFERAI